MGGLVISANVSLDLDDLGDPPTSRVVTDQVCAEKRSTRLEGRSRQGRPFDETQPARG